MLGFDEHSCVKALSPSRNPSRIQHMVDMSALVRADNCLPQWYISTHHLLSLKEADIINPNGFHGWGLKSSLEIR